MVQQDTGGRTSATVVFLLPPTLFAEAFRTQTIYRDISSATFQDSSSTLPARNYLFPIRLREKTFRLHVFRICLRKNYFRLAQIYGGTGGQGGDSTPATRFPLRYKCLTRGDRSVGSLPQILGFYGFYNENIFLFSISQNI